MKILVVDDSKLQCKYIISLLNKAGHQCITADNGEDAIAKYQEYNPNLIILDVELPGMKGYEVAKTIRKLDEASNKTSDIYWTPIIFLSGLFDEEYLEKCILSGGDDYLYKPPNEIILNAKIYAMDRLVNLQKKVIEQQMQVKDREKTKSLQQFSFGVAHEIRNPLAAIVHSSQNLIRRLKPDLPANIKAAEELSFELEKFSQYAEKREIVSFAEDILNSSKRVSDIIDTLLRVTESSEKKHTTSNIISIIDTSIALLNREHNPKHQISLDQVELIREYAQNPIYTDCCANEIEQIIYIVLKNAIYAITNISRTPKIKIKVFVEDSLINIQITDNGIGIPNDIIAKVFDPFFTTKPVGQGLGLGLTVAYSIITNKHNGNIYIKSKENLGTTVFIKLPITR